MSKEQQKLLAHELTMEYIHANPNILQDVLDNIPKMTEQIADINKRFYDAIAKSKTFQSLY